LRVLIRELGIRVQQYPGHHQVACDAVGIVLAERPEAPARSPVELGSGDIIGDLGRYVPRDSRCSRWLVTPALRVIAGGSRSP
jgi:hypothetical protein